ncbi:hypothetical protein FACS189419_03910 [Planctomycetales bacterium]|nr:hypothetical protein FACS189419_03910 [Planctomycetales bacterium]
MNKKGGRPGKRAAGRKRPAPSSLFAHHDSGNAGQRLQKILAVAGFGSRRECEELIEHGRIEINGSIAKLGAKANLQEDEIKVDGQRLKTKSKPVYIALYKPRGYLCTNYDQQGRARAVDLVPESFGRLFLVGRLDKDSEGLILLTNDGALSERLTHPKYGVEKIYRVQVAGDFKPEDAKQIRDGVYLAEGFAKADNVVIKRHYKQSTILDLTLSEGINREIRRLLARIGHKVLALVRIAVGPVKIGKMLPGDWRQLTHHEIDRLTTYREKQKETAR